MPSFPLSRRSRRASELNHDIPGQPDSQASVEDNNGDKVQRRQSRRDFFRNLLRPGSSAGSSLSGERLSGQIMTSSFSQQDPISRNKTMSPSSDPNKPLPPPPPAGASEASEPVQPATKKLQRIISPITMPDIHRLFSGAPQFFVRSEGHHTGAPHPSVAFPWDIELEIRDLSDHGQIEDQAWGTVTTMPHLTRNTLYSREETRHKIEKQKAYFVPRCHERPNMLSMQGLERGTMGFQAALEMDVADALQQDDVVNQIDDSVASQRNKFLNDKKHGVRPLHEVAVISKLRDVTTYYRDALPRNEERTPLELYTEIFTKVLFPPTRVTDSDDPYSLHVQIEALVTLLATPTIWINFGLIEWRIKFGQLLWGPYHEPDTEDDVLIDSHFFHEMRTERFWLLLQILLSCELIVRLDSLSKLSEVDPYVITNEEIHRFEKDATINVRWSLLLARLWLENIDVETSGPEVDKDNKEATGGWLSGLANAIHGSSNEQAPILQFEFKSRHLSRQYSGLLHFARKLHWPDVDDLAESLTQLPSIMPPHVSNPSTAGTPLTITKQRSSYFENSTRPSVERSLSKQHLSATIHPSGWLSRSYLTALILPGECLSHLLISTLLENDANALSQLGEVANLYGGFVYNGKSFWSTTCIIGRVLAARKGASECMGWLSSDVLPRGSNLGWINVDVDLTPKSEEQGDRYAARIWKKQTVERDSHVLGDGDPTSILPGDFSLPIPDVKDPIPLEVGLQSLDLFASVDSAPSTPQRGREDPIEKAAKTHEIQTYSAMLQFIVLEPGNEKREMSFALTYDVRFVTAHPCVPSSSTKLLNSPTSPTFHIPEVPPESDWGNHGPHRLFSGHPLHKSYTYSRHSISEVLLTSGTSQSFPLASLHTSSHEVFVIDCNEPDPPEADTMDGHPSTNAFITRKRRFGSDLEMLARAWCSEKGYNALISRRGRNCIACSIREARALGWKIVLRFG